MILNVYTYSRHHRILVKSQNCHNLWLQDLKGESIVHYLLYNIMVLPYVSLQCLHNRFLEWLYPTGGGTGNVQYAALGAFILWTTWYIIYNSNILSMPYGTITITIP